MIKESAEPRCFYMLRAIERLKVALLFGFSSDPHCSVSQLVIVIVITTLQCMAGYNYSKK